MTNPSRNLLSRRSKGDISIRLNNPRRPNTSNKNSPPRKDSYLITPPFIGSSLEKDLSGNIITNNINVNNIFGEPSHNENNIEKPILINNSNISALLFTSSSHISCTRSNGPSIRQSGRTISNNDLSIRSASGGTPNKNRNGINGILNDSHGNMNLRNDGMASPRSMRSATREAEHTGLVNFTVIVGKYYRLHSTYIFKINLTLNPHSPNFNPNVTLL